MGGFTLEDNYDAISQMPPYPRAVQIMHDGAILALSGERKISIMSRGVEQLEFRLARITPASINHLVSQSRRQLPKSRSFPTTTSTRAIFPRNWCAACRSRPATQRRTTTRRSISPSSSTITIRIAASWGFSSCTSSHGRAGEDGAYYQPDGSVIEAKDIHDWQGKRQDPADFNSLLSDRRLILVTDLGLIVKDNADGTHDVFVQSIKTGEPVGGAQVDVLGKNGLAVVSVKTDDTGHAAIPALGRLHPGANANGLCRTAR